MRYFVVLCLVCCVLFNSQASANNVSKAFHQVAAKQWNKARRTARNTGNRDITDAVEWFYLTKANPLPPFSAFVNFADHHPDWPKRDSILLRAEQALMHQNQPDNVIYHWLKTHPAKTKWGKLKLAEISNNTSKSLIRDVWIDGDFSISEESRIKNAYGKWLSQSIHAARANRLLWEGKPTAAGHLLSNLNSDDRKLVEARIYLQKRRKGLMNKINAVPAKYKRHAGLVFDRIKYRSRGKNPEIAGLLSQVDGNVPYPKKWWKYRKLAIQKAMQNGQYANAERLADNHGQSDVFELSEALWMQGWISNSFRGKPSKAFTAFTRLHNTVKYPISKSRGAFWAGLAAKNAGNKRDSSKWFRKAAKYTTTFYGQLAHQEIYGNKSLSFPSHPRFSRSDWEDFLAKTPLARTAMTLGKSGVEEHVWVFVKHLMKQADNAKEAALVANLGTAMNRPDIAVRASKQAVRQGYFLQKTSYPVINIPHNMSIEPEIAYAIMRQESSFYHKAKSRAGARGMMQLMPATARIVAKKNGRRYSLSKLYNPTYNIELGSSYLGGLIEQFNGSYAKAAAGYNAGPGRPRLWSKKYGHVGRGEYRMLDWIESIPFSETRNYVQRVLENYQVYRAVLSGGSASNNAYKTMVR